MKKHSILHKIKFAPVLAAALALVCAGALAQGAVVDNGSDPASRLNLREMPAKNAALIGRLLSGAQVEILGEADGWSQIAIGSGMGTVKGYVMTQYLSDAVRVDATYAASVASPYGTPSVVLRDRPSNSYDAVAMLMVGDSVLVIGEMDGFRFVQTGSGCVGCLLESELK